MRNCHAVAPRSRHPGIPGDGPSFERVEFADSPQSWGPGGGGEVNLLVDAIISVRQSGGEQRLSLPAVLALAQRDAITDFPALRPHQAPAWHMLLVQLAVLATDAVGGALPQDEAEWRDALRALTPGFDEDEPWSLVVEDWNKPAFLQPPLAAAKARGDYKRVIATPDALDLLVTSKNHDLKGERMALAQAEDWLYALVSLQTMEGFLGAGNYGIARMNGGFASRPMLRIAPAGVGIGGQWLRDVKALLATNTGWRKQTDASGIGVSEPVTRLLWLAPWDGDVSLSLAHLHPLAVEICRRLRLRDAGNGRIEAVGATSKVARVDAKQAKGVVGDPWMPTDLRDAKEGPKAFTPTAEGFGYRRMSLLLDDTLVMPSFLQQPTKDEQRAAVPMELVAAALTRGQGKTEGFHQRRILLGKRTMMALASDDQRLAKRAAAFVELASKGSGRVLRPAIIQLLDGKPEPDWKKPGSEVLARPWQAALDAAIDARFFDELDASFEADENDDQAASRWEQVLADLIRAQFDRAALSLPRKGEGRYFAEGRARNRLEGALRKEYLSLRDSKPPQDDHEQEDADAHIGEEHA